jgi:N-acetylglucosaminyldiphosphoundecaprenol N-acetyl-beta-D-mannosaminyltransferase
MTRSDRRLPPADGPPRVDVLGVGVSCVTLDSAVEEVSGWVDREEHRYVCVTGVHGVMESQRDPHLLQIHNRSGMTTPDGMPMVWSARWAGRREVSRVYGPDLMLAVLDHAVERGWSSYFYGGGPGTAELLVEKLSVRFPGLPVAGIATPPFRPLTDEEDEAAVAAINDSGAQLVWVGLSTPKQERWMADHVGKLEANVLFGVGAAFDLHAGTLPQAPLWMQRGGLEWGYRLAREPRRLWRRYFRNNPAFVLGIAARPPRLIQDLKTSQAVGDKS